VQTQTITELPDKLESLYVDAQNKIFLLNGKPIGEGIESVQINFDGTKWRVTMECTATVTKEISTYSKDGERVDIGESKGVERCR
jgi:hypothetical protein